MRTLVFYTKEQNEKLLEELKSGKRISVIARTYGHMWAKSIKGLEVKLYNIRDAKGIPKTPKAVHVKKEAKVVKSPKLEAKLTLPEGMRFEGTAKRVELHSTHFRVYF